MSWFTLAIISVVSISFATIIQRVMMKEKDSDPLASAIIFQFLLAIITGVYALFQGFEVPPIMQYPVQFITSSVMYACGTLLWFKVMKKISASDATIMSTVGAIVTIILSFIFLKEQLTLMQSLGAFLILSSIGVLYKKEKNRDFSGLLLAALGTSCYAVAVVSDTYIISRYDAVSYLPVMCLLPGILLLIVFPKAVFRMSSYFNKKYLSQISLYTLLYSIQAVTFYMALEKGAKASQMGTVSRFSIILTLLLAAIFLKERERLQLKTISAVLATIGVLLIQ